MCGTAARSDEGGRSAGGIGLAGVRQLAGRASMEGSVPVSLPATEAGGVPATLPEAMLPAMLA